VHFIDSIGEVVIILAGESLGEVKVTSYHYNQGGHMTIQQS